MRDYIERFHTGEGIALAEKSALAEKYPHLKGIFFTGSLKGQVTSIFRDRVEKPEKARDFIQAVHNGDISLGTEPLPKALIVKLVEIGVQVPRELVPAG